MSGVVKLSLYIIGAFTFLYGENFHKETIVQENKIKNLTFDNHKKAVEISEIKCDTVTPFYNGVEYGRNQNWHFIDNNVTFIKERNFFNYHFFKDTIINSKYKKEVKGKGEINYYKIEKKH